MDMEPICRHCRLPLGAADVSGFCCAGCRTAFEVINTCGLQVFYRLRRDAPGKKADVSAEEAGAWLDGEAFSAKNIHRLADGRSLIRWRVEGVHCSACVWLLEHLPRMNAGISAARVDLSSDALTVVFAHDQCPPSRQVAIAASLGYRLRPHRDADDGGRVVARRDLVRLVVSLASATAAMHVVMNLLAGGLTGDLDPVSRQTFAWLSLPVAAPALTYGAWPFWRGAVTALRLRRVTLDVTTALVLLVAIMASLAHLGQGGDLYLDAAAMFVALLLTGRAAAAAARRAAVRQLGGLDGLLPVHAVRLVDGVEHSVVAESLVPGDLVMVLPSTMVPCDGVVENAGRVSVAVLTGESRSVSVDRGDEAWAGSVNQGERLLVRASACGASTRVGGLLNRARAMASVSRPAADAWQGWFAVFILVVSLATWLVWRQLDPSRALDQTVAMVLALCPCALGIGVPLVHAVATARAARRGLVVRDPTALTDLASISDVVFDKTGTLTKGEPGVVAWEVMEAAPPGMLSWIVASEQRSRHPVAAALVNHLLTAGTTAAVMPAGACEEVPGCGMSVQTPWGMLRIGTPDFCQVPAWPVVRGASALAASLDGRLMVRAAVGDALKPGAHELVAGVIAMGKRVHLLSGDESQLVADCGAELGFPSARIHGGKLPDDKRQMIERLVQRGATVAMFGDGLNDAAALSAAHVGIGVRGGLAACLERCGIVSMSGTCPDVAMLMRGARQVRNSIRWCLTIALLYNLVAAGLVLGGAWGPLVCAVAMPASSLSVLLVALAGRAFR